MPNHPTWLGLPRFYQLLHLLFSLGVLSGNDVMMMKVTAFNSRSFGGGPDEKF